MDEYIELLKEEDFKEELLHDEEYNNWLIQRREETISKLEALCWKRCFNHNEYYWKDNSNRYVSFDGGHIDCHIFNNGKYFVTYLYLEELNLFTTLFNLLAKEELENETSIR